MKISTPRVSSIQGSSLFVTLIICAILSFSIFGYLSLVEQQSRLSSRSMAWNAAIAVSEAGIEEGLQHLNVNRTNLNSDGWTRNGVYYTRSNYLSDGNGYFVRIDNTTPNYPEITSQAYVRPLQLAKHQGTLFFAATGVSEPVVISRKVRVKCRRGGMFLMALAAKKIIDLKGNDIKSDSFDSTSSLYSNNGLYDPNPLKVRDNGDVASNSSITNSIKIGNANIYGHVSTGPGGSVSIGNGAVGTHAWQATHKGIEDGYLADDANFTFPKTDLPYNTGNPPPSGYIPEWQDVITTNAAGGSNPPNYNPWGGIQTNFAYTTPEVGALPNPVPAGLKTNVYTAKQQTYGNIPSGSQVSTNIIDYVTTDNWGEVPAGAQVTTNNTGQTIYSDTYPQPPPPGLKTNLVWAKEKLVYPATGTYVGQVQTNGVNYSYWAIKNYEWPRYAYVYPVYEYSYNYYRYLVPDTSYAWNTYTTNTIWVTNFYDYVLDGGDYYLSTYKGKMYVKGKANLVIGNGINMGGNELIKIGSNGSLMVWGGGNSAAISGNAVINKSGIAGKCIFYCAPTVTKLTFNGNGEFTGVVAAPEADTTMNGGGTGFFDLIGCVMVKSAVLNGSYSFHYDEALGAIDNGARFLIRSWDEIAVTP